ncbi:MAG: tetratricopeptide repeat protein, partial [Nitrospirae bacterium]|nr:tetratricopeptide repeat protein [Nitrospirota bacterium]
RRYHNNLGYAYGMIERYPDALREFLQGGTEAAAFNNLGFSYQAGGDLNQARDLYRRALEIDPGLKTARQNLAALCRSRTSEDGACVLQDGNGTNPTEAP